MRFSTLTKLKWGCVIENVIPTFLSSLTTAYFSVKVFFKLKQSFFCNRLVDKT